MTARAKRRTTPAVATPKEEREKAAFAHSLLSSLVGWHEGRAKRGLRGGGKRNFITGKEGRRTGERVSE